MRYEVQLPEGSSPEEQTVCAYLTDSTERDRVRTPVEPGTVEIGCAVVNRNLTRDERLTWRNYGLLPGGIGVNPAQVECVVIASDKSELAPTVEQRGDGIYVATVDAARRGIWVYRFEGQGGCTFSEERVFEVR